MSCECIAHVDELLELIDGQFVGKTTRCLVRVQNLYDIVRIDRCNVVCSELTERNVHVAVIFLCKMERQKLLRVE